MGNLANVSDVEARLGRTLTDDERARVPGLIAEASVLTMAYLGCPEDRWPGPDEDADGVGDDVPSAVRIVTSRMAARVLAQASTLPGAEVTQQSVGPFSTSWASGTTSGAPWLGAADQLVLKGYRCGHGLSVVTLAGEQVSARTGWWELQGEWPVVWVDSEGAWRIAARPVGT